MEHGSVRGQWALPHAPVDGSRSTEHATARVSQHGRRQQGVPARASQRDADTIHCPTPEHPGSASARTGYCGDATRKSGLTFPHRLQSAETPVPSSERVVTK
jgi:hypothetical protein